MAARWARRSSCAASPSSAITTAIAPITIAAEPPPTGTVAPPIVQGCPRLSLDWPSHQCDQGAVTPPERGDGRIGVENHKPGVGVAFQGGRDERTGEARLARALSMVFQVKRRSEVQGQGLHDAVCLEDIRGQRSGHG